MGAPGRSSVATLLFLLIPVVAVGGVNVWTDVGPPGGAV
jgi:hypothetical protein